MHIIYMICLSVFQTIMVNPNITGKVLTEDTMLISLYHSLMFSFFFLNDPS